MRCLIDGSLLIKFGGFKMEKLDWRNASSLAKSMGTIVLITGALIMTYYKGPPPLMTPHLIIPPFNVSWTNQAGS